MKPRYPVTGEKKAFLHENDDSYIDDSDAGNMSEQEQELHKIRDRIRIRLNLMEFDFRMLEKEINHLQKQKMTKGKGMDGIMDGDRDTESEKDMGKFGYELSVVQRCLLENQALMSQM